MYEANFMQELYVYIIKTGFGPGNEAKPTLK